MRRVRMMIMMMMIIIIITPTRKIMGRAVVRYVHFITEKLKIWLF
jgi:hypothetical protein